MNTIRMLIQMVFCLFIFNHYILCMKDMQTSRSFQFFSNLLPEVQYKILKYADSKASFQLLNRQWCECASIKSPHVFDNDLAGLSKERMIRVLIHAAYGENYVGVENILKNSSLLQLTKNNDNTSTLHCDLDLTDGRKIIDFYTIISDKQEKKWLDLLPRYNIVKASDLPDPIVIDPLIISCLAGNSYAMRAIVCDIDVNLKDALYIAINCGYYSCVKTLVNIVYDVSSWGEWDSHMKNITLLLSLDALKFACSKKNIKIIEEILKTREFDINKIHAAVMPPATFLDHVLEKAQNDDEYNNIVSLLQNYGAKTMQEITDEENIDDFDLVFRVMSCSIS